MRTMGAGEFKAKCLAVMAEVDSTGVPVLVTKRGKPLARILPFEEEPQSDKPASVFGFLRGMAVITGDLVSSEFSDEEWDKMAAGRLERVDPGGSR